jgi:hypothetical protein
MLSRNSKTFQFFPASLPGRSPVVMRLAAHAAPNRSGAMHTQNLVKITKPRNMAPIAQQCLHSLLPRKISSKLARLTSAG